MESVGVKRTRTTRNSGPSLKSNGARASSKPTLSLSADLASGDRAVRSISVSLKDAWAATRWIAFPSTSRNRVLRISWRAMISCQACPNRSPETRPCSRQRTATLYEGLPGSSRSSSQKRSCATEQGKSVCCNSAAPWAPDTSSGSAPIRADRCEYMRSLAVAITV